MSLFLAVFDTSSANILTDTLATTPAGEPYLYVTKATPVPQMRTVMVCTGLADLGDRWAAMLRNGVLALDVEMLDWHTPGSLRELWQASREEYGFGDELTSTVYHLGMTRGGECRVYAYRSTSDFASERLPEHGLAIKPEPVDWDGLPQAEDLDGLVAIAEYLRAEQGAYPPAERIHIGGELFLTSVTSHEIAIRLVHTFDDHDEAWNSMNAVQDSSTG